MPPAMDWLPFAQEKFGEFDPFSKEGQIYNVAIDTV
jgi:hypothetical protein